MHLRINKFIVCTDTKKGLQVELQKSICFLIISVLLNLLWEACIILKHKKIYKNQIHISKSPKTNLFLLIENWLNPSKKTGLR